MLLKPLTVHASGNDYEVLRFGDRYLAVVWLGIRGSRIYTKNKVLDGELQKLSFHPT